MISGHDKQGGNIMNDSKYKNMLKRHANSSLERAFKWEKMAKDNKAKGFFDLAICAARQARRCRQDAARCIESLNKP